MGLKGGGDDDGRRACNNVGRQRHGSSPGGGRAVHDVGLKGGDGDGGRRACDNVSRSLPCGPAMCTADSGVLGVESWGAPPSQLHD